MRRLSSLPAINPIGVLPDWRLMFFLVDLWQLDVFVLELAFKRFDERVLEYVHDRRHDVWRWIVEVACQRNPRPEAILRMIADDAGQPADDSLPDEIDRVIAVVRRIEDRTLQRAFAVRSGRPSMSISATSVFDSFLLLVKLVPTICTRSNTTSTSLRFT